MGEKTRVAISTERFSFLTASRTLQRPDFGNLLDVNRAVKSLAQRYPIFRLDRTWLAPHLRGISVDVALGGSGRSERLPL